MTSSRGARRPASPSETSKTINQNRLKLQEERMNLIEKLKEEVLVGLKEELKDQKKYRKLIKELIVQVVSSEGRVLSDSWKTTSN